MGFRLKGTFRSQQKTSHADEAGATSKLFRGVLKSFRQIEGELSFSDIAREQKLQLFLAGTIGSRRPTKEVQVPDDNKSNRGRENEGRGNRENESKQSPGRESENDRGSSSTSDRERDSKGRFESDDSESGSSSSRGGSSSGSSGSSSGASSKKK
jgi:hypothetical protein